MRQLWAFRLLHGGGVWLSAWLLAVGCQPASQRSTNGGRDAAKVAKEKVAAEGEEDPEAEDDAEDEDLPPYLLSRADARKLAGQPFLKAKYMPDDWDAEPIKRAGDASELADFLGDFIDDVVAIKELKAGRKIKTYFVADEAVNASMDAWHRMKVNSGNVAVKSVLGLLPTLCHELGHSARNHGYQQYFPDADEKPGMAAANDFYEDIGSYWDEQYKDGIYTHDLSAYNKLYKRWQRIVDDFGDESKRQESEADAVGVLICGQLGMSVADFIKGDEQSYEAAGADANTKPELGAVDLEDGEEIEVESESEFLYYYLFAYDSHPLPKQRLAQLRRLSEDLTVAEPGQPSLYKRWREDYPDLRDDAAKALGMSLTAAPPSRLRQVGRVKGSGRALTIDGGDCRHGLRRAPHR